MSKPFNVGVLGTGRALPSEVLENGAFASLGGVSDEWITKRSGIKERRKANASEFTSTLGTQAATRALEMATVHATEIDLIICTTISPDTPMPSTACWIQAALGATSAACFDLAAACTGFLYGLEVADKLIKSGSYRNALVISTDLMTRYVDYDDPKTRILFGDGAGAVVLASVSGSRGMLQSKIYSDGRLAELVQTPGGGTRHPISPEMIQGKMHYMKMKGSELFRITLRSMTEASLMVLNEAGLGPEDVDLVIPHQANQRILDDLIERLGLPASKLYSNIERVGNTASASIPIALDECVRAERIKQGDLLLLTAFGGGATWGAAVLKW